MLCMQNDSVVHGTQHLQHGCLPRVVSRSALMFFSHVLLSLHVREPFYLVNNAPTFTEVYANCMSDSHLVKSPEAGTLLYLYTHLLGSPATPPGNASTAAPCPKCQHYQLVFYLVFAFKATEPRSVIP